MDALNLLIKNSTIEDIIGHGIGSKIMRWLDQCYALGVSIGKKIQQRDPLEGGFFLMEIHHRFGRYSELRSEICQYTSKYAQELGEDPIAQRKLRAFRLSLATGDLNYEELDRLLAEALSNPRDDGSVLEITLIRILGISDIRAADWFMATSKTVVDLDVGRCLRFKGESLRAVSRIVMANDARH